MARSAKKPDAIEIPKINVQVTRLVLVCREGSELIMNKWSEKAKMQIKEKQAGKTKTQSKAREPRDPQAEYEATIYRFDDGRVGFPSVAFKSAVASAAATLVAGITGTFIRKSMHIIGELVEIHGEPYMREDMVRLGGMSNPADIRYRAGFKDWWCELAIEHDPNVLSVEQLVALVELAGYSVGVGENRPEKSGNVFGRFRVADTDEAEKLLSSVS